MPARRPILSHVALRGIAALLVVLYHLQRGYSDASSFERATPFFERGYLWVDLFFVLSGFILSYVNDHGPSFRWHKATLASFFVGRFARIYPLHAVVLMAYVVALGLLSGWAIGQGHVSPADWSAPSLQLLLAQFLLINAWIAGASGWNVPTWSISAEAVAYLLFPAALAASARLPRPTGVVLLLAIVGFYGAVAAISGSLDVVGGAEAIGRCLAGFALGMLVYQYRAGLARLAPALRSVAQAGIVAALVLVLASRSNDVLTIPLFAALVGLTWTDEGILAPMLRRPSLLWLGERSYSVYLLHAPVLAILSTIWGRINDLLPDNPDLRRAAWLATFLALVLSLAALTFRFVERPARQWLLRHWLHRPAPPIIMAAPAP